MDTDRLAQLLKATREGDRVAAQALADYLEENDLKDVVAEGLSGYAETVTRRLVGRGVLPPTNLWLQMKRDVEDAVEGVLGQGLGHAFEEIFPTDPTIAELIAEEGDGLKWAVEDHFIRSVRFAHNVCRVKFGFTLNAMRPGEVVDPKDDPDSSGQIGGHATLEILPDAWAFTDITGVLAEHEDDG
jgi:hypothetical protein